jgi:hypothetical protein
MKTMLTSLCLSIALAVGASSAFAAKKVRHHQSAARAQAPIVEPYSNAIAPIPPRPVDEVWGACGHMDGVFSCPGN